MASCDACGRTGHAERCRPCDVTVCGRCLGDTRRCPSCQRPFVQTAPLPPVARVPAPTLGGIPRSLIVGLCLFAVVVVSVVYAILVSGRNDETRAARRGFVIQPDEEPAEPGVLRALVDERAEHAGPFVMVDRAACPIEVTPLVRAPSPPTGAVRERLDAELAAVVGANLDVFASTDDTPWAAGSRFGDAPPSSRLELIVDGWRDPSSTQPGRLEGRALLYHGGTRPLCVTEVAVERSPAAEERLDDARLALVWAALEESRRTLHAAPD